MMKKKVMKVMKVMMEQFATKLRGDRRGKEKEAF